MGMTDGMMDGMTDRDGRLKQVLMKGDEEERGLVFVFLQFGHAVLRSDLNKGDLALSEMFQPSANSTDRIRRPYNLFLFLFRDLDTLLGF